MSQTQKTVRINMKQRAAWRSTFCVTNGAEWRRLSTQIFKIWTVGWRDFCCYLCYEVVRQVLTTNSLFQWSFLCIMICVQQRGGDWIFRCLIDKFIRRMLKSVTLSSPPSISTPRHLCFTASNHQGSLSPLSSGKVMDKNIKSWLKIFHSLLVMSIVI